MDSFKIGFDTEICFKDLELIYMRWIGSKPIGGEVFQVGGMRGMVQEEYCSPSLVWHIWETQKMSYYRGVVFSSIWQMA